VKIDGEVCKSASDVRLDKRIRCLLFMNAALFLKMTIRFTGHANMKQVDAILKVCVRDSPHTAAGDSPLLCSDLVIIPLVLPLALPRC
jgi:hypothetical protein